MFVFVLGTHTQAAKPSHSSETPLSLSVGSVNKFYVSRLVGVAFHITSVLDGQMLATSVGGSLDHKSLRGLVSGRQMITQTALQISQP